MTTAFEEALECVIDGVPSALGLWAAGQVVEYEVSPLPLAARGVCGIGVHEGRLLLSIGAEERVSTTRRMTRGILLDVDLPGGAWALEVDGVVGFVRARAHATTSWRARATTEDGRELQFIDVARLVGLFRDTRP